MFVVERLHYSVDFLKSTRNFTVNVLRAGHGVTASATPQA